MVPHTAERFVRNMRHDRIFTRNRSSLRFLYLCKLGIFLSGCQQMDFGTASSNSICSDDFNRADSSELGGNWSIGANFPQTSAATAGIEDNKGRISIPMVGPIFEAHCKNKIVQSKVRSSVTFNLISGSISNQPILVTVRLQDQLNAYICGTRNGQFDLSRSVNSASTTLATAAGFPGNFNAGGTFKIVFEAEGSKLTCALNLNGSLVVLSSHDDMYSQGYTGFFFANTMEMYFDDFRSEAYP